jgi:alpha-D-xyloside xylohydrolase
MPLLARDGAVIPRVEVDATVRSVADVLDAVDRPWTLHAYGPTAQAPSHWVGFDGSARAAGTEVVRHGA